jgi:hypothetical protein
LKQIWKCILILRCDGQTECSFSWKELPNLTCTGIESKKTKKKKNNEKKDKKDKKNKKENSDEEAEDYDEYEIQLIKHMKRSNQAINVNYYCNSNKKKCN